MVSKLSGVNPRYRLLIRAHDHAPGKRIVWITKARGGEHVYAIAKGELVPLRSLPELRDWLVSTRQLPYNAQREITQQ